MSTQIRLERIEKRLIALERRGKATSVNGSDVYSRRVLLAVAHVAGVTVKGIRSEDKSRRNVEARLACASIMDEDSRMTGAEIGEAIGRDRTSVSGYKHSFRRIGVREIAAKARELMEDESC